VDEEVVDVHLLGDLVEPPPSFSVTTVTTVEDEAKGEDCDVIDKEEVGP